MTIILSLSLAGELRNIFAVKNNFAARRLLHVHNRFEQSRLAATRFADNADGLAFANVESYIVASSQKFPAAHGEFFCEIFDAHDNFRHNDASPFPARSPAKIVCSCVEDF